MDMSTVNYNIKTKKRCFRSLLLILFLALSKTGLAQSDALSSYSDLEIAKGLLDGTIKHSDIPLERNENIYSYFRKEYIKKYHPNSKTGFFSVVPHNGLFSFLQSKPAFIEVEDEQGDIYTWPVAFQNNDGSFILYTDKMKPDNSTFALFTNIQGHDYPSVQEKMNMMRIGKKNKPKPIRDVLFSTSWDHALIINPTHAMTSSSMDMCLFCFSVIYNEGPSFRRYSNLDYVVVAGKKFSTDYETPKDDPKHVGYLTLIDPRRMKSKTSTALLGVPNPTLYGMFPKRTHIFCGNNSFYDVTQYHSKNVPFKDRWRVISQNRTPIYVLKSDWAGIEGSIVPGDGDIVFDIVENDKYIMYCGSNNKHGYVGFDNPTLVIIDKNTHEEIARYNSRLQSQRKGKVFSRMRLLANDQLYLEILGVNGHSHDEQYNPTGECIVEVVSISSLIE